MVEQTKQLDEATDYRLDDQVGFILRRASQRHLAIFAEEIGDMTPTQFAALAKLVERGPVSQNELGRLTAMDAATIKGVIDRLRKRGYVETRPDPVDLRRLYAEANAEGQAAYRASVAAARQITNKTLAPLDAKERQTFLSLLKKLT